MDEIDVREVVFPAFGGVVTLSVVFSFGLSLEMFFSVRYFLDIYEGLSPFFLEGLSPDFLEGLTIINVHILRHSLVNLLKFFFFPDNLPQEPSFKGRISQRGSFLRGLGQTKLVQPFIFSRFLVFFHSVFQLGTILQLQYIELGIFSDSGLVFSIDMLI